MVSQVYPYRQTHQVVYINYMQLFVCQKIDGSSLRIFNLGENPQIIPVWSARLKSNQIGSVATGNLFVLTFQLLLVPTQQLFPIYIYRGGSICPFLVPFSSSHSLDPQLLHVDTFLSCSLSDTLPAFSVLFHHMVVIFSSPTSDKSFKNEKKRKPMAVFAFQTPHNRALPNTFPAHTLGACHGLCLTSPPVFPPQLQLGLPISSHLVIQTLFPFSQKEIFILQYPGLSSTRPPLPPPAVSVLFYFCLFFHLFLEIFLMFICF